MDAPTAPAAAASTPHGGFGIFIQVLVNTALANVTTSFLWFALTFWAYAQTRNVLVAGVIAASYMLFVSIFSMFFGTLVDRFQTKPVMAWATVIALAVFLLDAALFFAIGETAIIQLNQPWFWIFATVLLAGAVVEQLRAIALSTTVTLLVPEPRRANANGLVGTVQGVGMIVTSVFSGLSVGFLGMGWTLLIGIGALGITLFHLLFLRIPNREKALASEGAAGWVDLRGGWQAVRAVPGLLALVLFTTLNNLFGGVAMALMDPYGIELFGVQGWGIWFAVMSTGFIVGGSIVAARGLGKNPIHTMVLLCMVIGALGALSTIREVGWVFIAGIWLFMCTVPAVEAAEQTVIQRVVPYQQQGRVFGFANTFEAAAAPVTALLVAPLAELWIIPLLRTEAGLRPWQPILGTGDNRGIALIMLISGAICIVLALIALQTPQYRMLSRQFANGADQPEPPRVGPDALTHSTGADGPESAPNGEGEAVA